MINYFSLLKKSQFLVLAAVIAAANAIAIAPAYGGYGGYGAPAYGGHYGGIGIAKVAAPVIAKVTDDYDPNPQYSYSYDIHDALTGDTKNQQESRSGDVVQGSYSLIEPDGSRRTVEYTADPVHGFNAVVHREPVATKVIAKVAAPIYGHGLAPAYGHALAPAYGHGIAKVAAPYYG